MGHVQKSLFPHPDECFETVLLEQEQRLVSILDGIQVEKHVKKSLFIDGLYSNESTPFLLNPPPRTYFSNLNSDCFFQTHLIRCLICEVTYYAYCGKSLFFYNQIYNLKSPDVKVF